MIAGQTIKFRRLEEEYPDYILKMQKAISIVKGYDYEICHKPTGLIRQGFIKKDNMVTAEITILRHVEALEAELAKSGAV